MGWPTGEAWDYRVILMTQLTLFGVGWALALAYLQEERRAIAHWCGSSLSFALSLPFLQGASQTAVPPAWMTHGLMLTTLLGYLLAARGVDQFVNEKPRHDRFTLGTAAVALALLLALPTDGGFDRTRLVTLSLAKALLLFGGPVLVVKQLKAAIGWVGVAVALLPSAAYSLQGLVVAVYFGFLSSPVANLNAQMLNTPGKVIAALVAAGLFNFSFLFMLLSRLVAQLRHHATHDALTGVMNRHGLDAVLARHWRRQRHGQRSGLSVVLIDVDHFKRVNDEHGHPTGDEVLRRIAGVLVASVRPADLVARLGGEEFVVVLPDASASQAQDVAERMRSAVQEAELDLNGSRVRVTVSGGVAEWQHEDQHVGDLLARADLALYAAKGSGRNRVCIAGGKAPPAAAAN